MKFNPNSTYQIIINVKGTTLTYIAKVVGYDENFISFIDIHNKVYSYNLNNVVCLEEKKEDSK